MGTTTFCGFSLLVFINNLSTHVASGSYCYYSYYYYTYRCYYYYYYYYYSGSAGMIAGAVVGGLIALAAIIGIVVFICVVVCKAKTSGVRGRLVHPNSISTNVTYVNQAPGYAQYGGYPMAQPTMPPAYSAPSYAPPAYNPNPHPPPTQMQVQSPQTQQNIISSAPPPTLTCN